MNLEKVVWHTWAEPIDRQAAAVLAHGRLVDRSSIYEISIFVLVNAAYMESRSMMRRCLDRTLAEAKRRCQNGGLAYTGRLRDENR